ncbi:ATP-grasp domain-containing protein [Cohnella panacarvi]|uniref:ATP-grasp domain-containing protein n=1 Tax=Cohnella panacarvi TaxID=400776 RepID=UPI00047D1707|nr:ATP-grasp domain-containing protein [Cohnella panacarvi]
MGDNRVLNILIPSAGGVSGTFLIRHLSRNKVDGYDYRIVTADSNPQVAAKYFADAFYPVPMCGDARYESEIVEIIANERIDIIFPLASYDIPFFAARKTRLEQLGCRLLVCDLHTHERLHNKKKMYALMKSIGIAVPRVYEEGEIPAYPAILKSTESSGSRGVYRLDDDADYRYWSGKLGEHVATAFVQGTEYTVDCLFDRSGGLVAFNVRERLKTNGGAVVVTTQAEPSEALRFVLRQLEKHLALEGPVNFQYIADRDNRLFLTDFNTRFASGGLPLTIAAGCDIPNLMIRLMLGLDVEVPERMPTKLTMYRYYDEFYAEEL